MVGGVGAGIPCIHWVCPAEQAVSSRAAESISHCDSGDWGAPGWMLLIAYDTWRLFHKDPKGKEKKQMLQDRSRRPWVRVASCYTITRSTESPGAILTEPEMGTLPHLYR